MYHIQVAWPQQSSAVQPQLIPGGSASGMSVPKIDVFETLDEVVFLFEMPGINPDQLEVETRDGNLVVSAPILSINPQEAVYRYQERAKGSLSRVVPLTSDIDADNVTADLRNGLLEVRFRKTTSANQGRKIRVATG